MFQILSATISNNCKYVAIATRNNILRAMNFDTQEELWCVHQDEWILGMVYSPDGRYIATRHASGKLGIREAHTGKVYRTLERHQNPICSIGFVPDSPLVITSARDDATIIHNYLTGDVVKSFRDHEYKSVTCVSCSPNGKYIAIGGWDNRVYIYTTDQFELISTLHEYASYVSALTWRGDTLISGGSGGSVSIWDIISGKCMQILPRCSGTVSMLYVTQEYLIVYSSYIVSVWYLHDTDPVLISQVRIGAVMHHIGERGVLYGDLRYVYIQEIPILNFYKIISESLLRKPIHDPRIVYRIAKYIS